MSSNLKRNVNKMGTRPAVHYKKWGRDQQLTIKKMWMRPAAYYKLLKSKIMNNQIGDNNY